MKETTILFFLSLFFISSLSGFSQITTFPHQVSFESLSDLGTTASDADSKWTTAISGSVGGNALDEEITFTRLSGATPSNAGAGTGPSAAAGGSYGSYYIYMESSGGTSGHTAELVLRYDLRCHNAATLSFIYHNYGAGSEGPATAGVFIYNETDSVWSSQLWGSSSSNNAWYWQDGNSSGGLDISAYDGKIIQIWFTATSGGYRSDFALDYITVNATRNSSMTWDGSSSTAWATAANWSTDCVPIAGDAAIIADVTNDPDITTNVTLEDITIQSGAILDINSTGSLTLTDDFTNSSGTVNLNSAADHFPAIKVAGDASGNITYNRYVNAVGTDEWDLIGSPVDGLSISSFASTNTSGTPTLATNGSGQYAIGVYDNSDDSWTNYTTGSIGAAGNFDVGKGYAMASVSGGTGLLAFTGTIVTTDQTQAIVDNSSSGRRWDLIANPFPSFVNANDDADGSNNFLTVNTAKLDDTYEAVYGYDADGTGYTAYNHIYNTNTAVYIAPGQAFMVASDNTSADTVSFTEAMQTVSGADDFIDDVLNDVFEVLLRLYHGNEEIEETRLYFEDGLSLGLNPGYDAGAFDQNAALMTRLVEDDQGHGLVINAMSPEDMDNVVIPLEINQTAGQEFRVNLHTSTIGEVNVYLEDTELQTLTLLNEEDFVLTPTSDLSDVGRFYVHLTADTLSNEEVNTSLLNAYKGVDNNYITIEGLATQLTSTEVSLYNILGTKVMNTTLDNTTNTQTVSTNRLSTGIYVIKLVSGQDQLTKKLIIK